MADAHVSGSAPNGASSARLDRPVAAVTAAALVLLILPDGNGRFIVRFMTLSLSTSTSWLYAYELAAIRKEPDEIRDRLRNET
jgi:hypothetical protein